MNRGVTVQGLVQELRRAFPATHGVALRLGEVRIAVQCNTPELAGVLKEYFAEFLTEAGPAEIDITVHEGPAPEFAFDFTVKAPDPGKTKIKEEWKDLPDGRIVRKRLTGLVFIFGQSENLAVGPCLENANQVVNFINNRFIEWQLNRGCLLGHAAAVAHAGRGLSLAGFSGMGKSTLALHIMSRGATFVSNDRVMLQDNGQGLVMHGVAKQPRINPGTALNNPDLEGIIEPENLERFKSLPPEELWRLEHKYDALIQECYGPDRFILSTGMDGLVILNWRREAGETVIKKVDPFERGDLLPAFMKSTGLFYLPGPPRPEGAPQDPSQEEYARALSKCDLIEISGGVDFDKAAQACMTYLETGTLPG